MKKTSKCTILSFEVMNAGNSELLNSPSISTNGNVVNSSNNRDMDIFI